MKRYVDIASVCTIIGNLFSIPYDFDRPITMDDVNESIEEIKSLPNADVVEREKIDKAIEEIGDLFDESLSEAPCSEMQFRCGLIRAREILERNIIGDNNG